MKGSLTVVRTYPSVSSLSGRLATNPDFDGHLLRTRGDESLRLSGVSASVTPQRTRGQYSAIRLGLLFVLTLLLAGCSWISMSALDVNAGVVAAIHQTATALRDHVVRVVLWRSKEQMGWVDARPVVTTMEHPQSCGDFAIRQSPSVAMRAQLAAAFRQHAVSVAHRITSPNPASAAFIDLRPEVCGGSAEGCSICDLRAAARAVTTASEFLLVTIATERTLAQRALEPRHLDILPAFSL